MVGFDVFDIKPIGVVEKPKRIRIFDEFREGLEGVREGSLMWVLFIMHRAGEKLKVHPRGDVGRPLRGVFSTRSPERPNRIGLTLVRIEKVQGNVLFIDNLDAFEGTPVIDLKPFSEFYDMHGCVLTAEDIKKRIENEEMIRDYIDLETQLQPNGFDCTLRAVGRIVGEGVLDFDNRERVIPDFDEIHFEDIVHLKPGVYRAVLNEVVKLGDDIMALARPRSSLIRCGANILTAVWDAGYEGRSEVGLVVYNERGIWLKRNARIVQMVFIKLTSKTSGYEGIYKGENI